MVQVQGEYNCAQPQPGSSQALQRVSYNILHPKMLAGGRFCSDLVLNMADNTGFKTYWQNFFIEVNFEFYVIVTVL